MGLQNLSLSNCPHGQNSVVIRYRAVDKSSLNGEMRTVYYPKLFNKIHLLSYQNEIIDKMIWMWVVRKLKNNARCFCDKNIPVVGNWEWTFQRPKQYSLLDCKTNFRDLTYEKEK